MSQTGPATMCASGSVSKKRRIWNRTNNDISCMISNSHECRAVQSTVSLDGEAKQDLELIDLFEEFSKLIRLETLPSIMYLRQLVNEFEEFKRAKCSFNRVHLKANVEMALSKKLTAHLNFRATNALHLSGSGLQTGKSLSFVVSLVDDGILFTDIEGLSVSVTVLKGTFRCEVLQARIQNTDGQLLLRLQTRNPLIGTTSDDELSAADLQADLYQKESADDECELKLDQLEERKQKARHLRSTASGIKAFDLTVNRLAQSALGLGVPEVPEGPRSRFECIKTIITMYAFSLVLVASYFYLMTKVPQIVPMAMTLSAISFFILGCERQWTYKTDLAVILNTFSMIVVTVCLYQIF